MRQAGRKRLETERGRDDGWAEKKLSRMDLRRGMEEKILKPEKKSEQSKKKTTSKAKRSNRRQKDVAKKRMIKNNTI